MAQSCSHIKSTNFHHNSKMVVFVQSILLALLFVTSVEFNLAATKEQGIGVWKPEEKMNLMKIWNRIYKGKRASNYKQTLHQEWLRIYPDGKGKTVNGLTNMVDRLLRDTFVIPPEDPSHNAIRLSMDVRQKRKSGFPDYVEILLPTNNGSSQRYSHYAHPQVDSASTSGHQQQTTHDVTDGETDREIGSKDERASPPWKPIDDFNLKKAIVNIKKYWKRAKYKEKLFEAFERSDPKPAKRTLDSVVDRARELRTEGFVIPAEHNNGEEIKVESEPRLSYTYWKPEEEIILMKALHGVQDYKGSKNYQKKLLEEWNRLHSRPSKRNIESVMHRARVLNRRGFVIPAGYNNEEEIRMEPDQTQQRTAWHPMEETILMKAHHAAQKYRGNNNYQQKLLEEWNNLHSTPSERSSQSVSSKAKKLCKSGFIIPAEYNDGDQSRSETIICEQKGKKKCQEPEIIDKPKNSKPGDRRRGYLNQSSNRSSDMDDQSEPGSSRTYDVYPSQSSSQTNIRNPYADVVMEDNVHQPLYYPQSAHFYHGSNDPSYGGSVTPRPRRGSHYSVYQSDIAQHHHGSSSTTHHQSQLQPDPRDESQPSTLHYIP